MCAHCWGGRHKGTTGAITGVKGNMLHQNVAIWRFDYVLPRYLEAQNACVEIDAAIEALRCQANALESTSHSSSFIKKFTHLTRIQRRLFVHTFLLLRKMTDPAQNKRIPNAERE